MRLHAAGGGCFMLELLSHLNTCRVDDKSLKESRKIDDELVGTFYSSMG